MGMCELLDLPTPPEGERLDLASRVLGWITRRIQATLPGVIEAIHLLHRQGVRAAHRLRVMLTGTSWVL